MICYCDGYQAFLFGSTHNQLDQVGVRIAGIDLPVMMPGRTAVQLQCVSALHQLLLCDTVKAPTGVPLNLTNVS